MTTIRESIPTEDIIRAYMDESIEHEEEVTIENVVKDPIIEHNSSQEIELTPVPEMKIDTPSLGVTNMDEDDVTTRLKFSDYDSVMDETNSVGTISAPKTIERLEEISSSHALQRKIDEAQDDDIEPLDFDKTATDVDVSLFDIEEIN